MVASGTTICCDEKCSPLGHARRRVFMRRNRCAAAVGGLRPCVGNGGRDADQARRDFSFETACAEVRPLSFRANVIAMLSGTVLAQAIPLLMMPLLTRLYTPEAIGLQTLFMGCAGALGVAATCRYDLAVVLSDTEEVADDVAGLVLGIAVLVTAVIVLIVASAGEPLAALAGQSGTTGWLWMLAPMAAGTALTLLASAYAARSRCFVRIAQASVANQAAYAIAAVAIGLCSASVQGLAAAKLIGQWMGLIVILLAFGFAIRRALAHHDWSRIVRAGRFYRQFLFYNAPYSLVGTVARDMPIFVFSAMSASAAAGFYGLTRTVLFAPTLLASGALSQVFFREAVSLKGSPRLQELTISLLKFGLLTGAPLFAFCAVWGDVFFETLFGSDWRQAGIFAMIMACAAWMALQTGWPERLFEVAMRQDVSFRVQVVADIVTVAAVTVPLILGAEIIVAVAAFTVANVLYHLAYLCAIFVVSGFSLGNLARALAIGIVGFCVSCAVLFALRLATVSSLGALLLAALVATVAAGGFARYCWQHLAPITQAKECAS